MSKNVPKRHEKSKVSTNFSSQHLLINDRIVQDLIDLAKINSTDTVLDIGAGTGAITFPLAEIAASVLAIENDPGFVRKLASKIQDKTNIRIHQMDVLQLNLPRKPFSVVANIPYSITTPILGKLLDVPTVHLQRAALIVEKGAAKRFTAVPITNPRILAWRMWFDFKLVRSVSSSHFSPPPRVESAILTVSRKKKPAVPPHHHIRFKALAANGLRLPQLPLVAALVEVFTPPQIAKLARMFGIDRNQPIGHLTEEQWGQLFLAMLQHVESYRWPKIPKNFRTHKKKR
ncbi:23S ribosomal RNA methyltransferase Erm [Paenibacillus azoreducens]|uniref:rRNA adenine N-6-methyltransferase n=1 Tax=Paenibacillus azoreducens TaxID=116718 RepID=A0A920CQF8_9BACL|nr:23S ribosomal RNA methyltransferase Erm [Paenibacillus azoreducens]GIO49781.1 hypothetical protein J34TS1_45460 [Paenibacillus azoreducens]